MNANVEHDVIQILQSVLGLDPAKHRLDTHSLLLGSVAELDSMAVVSVLTGIEERFGIAVDDDEVDGGTFASVGTVTEFVRSKLRSGE